MRRAAACLLLACALAPPPCVRGEPGKHHNLPPPPPPPTLRPPAPCPTLPPPPPPPKTIRWYVDMRQWHDHVAFAKAHASCVTGFIGSMGASFESVVHIGRNGTVSVEDGYDMLVQTQDVLAEGGLTYHAVVGVEEAAMLEGLAPRAVDDVVALAANASITGVIVNYVPRFHMTRVHLKAYVEFLQALKTAAGKRGLEVGMVVEDESIVSPLGEYKALALDSYVSLNPTLRAGEALSPIGVQFVRDMVRAYHNAAAIGIGSIPAAKSACALDYEWDSTSLQKFLDEHRGDGVRNIAVMRCETGAYNATADFFCPALTAWQQQ